MGVHTVRMPDNLDEYLNRLILKGYATSYANALNLITLERMMNDDKGTNLTPFHYTLKDNRIKDTEIDLSAIETDNVILSDNYETDLKIKPVEIRTETPVSNDDYRKINRMKKPVYPGSMKEYEHDPKRNMFEPPNE